MLAMLQKEMQVIFGKAQKNSSCHQKCVLVMTDLYKQTPNDEFHRVFLRFLQLCLMQPPENNEYTKRVLGFASLFCADITKKEGREEESHEFLTGVMHQVLEWARLDNYDVRYNSCCFISNVFQDVGEDFQLEIALIDETQDMLLERMQERKVPIRSVAISALLRLQDPQNPNCPVVHAYMEALVSNSAIIRREAVQSIAPTAATLIKIRERVHDVDASVRCAVFRKCADIGPLIFRIADRHLVLDVGFHNLDEKVKKVFFEYFLPKWLTAYKGVYLKFVGSLKLMGDEEDVSRMTELCEELIKFFFNKYPIDELIEALPVTADRLIDPEKLTPEVALFWNVLSELLKNSEHMEDYVERILPELTSFGNYIDRVIQVKSEEKMEDWQLFEYHFSLLKLLEIAQRYDYSDEVGRRTMQALIEKVLQNHSFSFKLTEKLVTISHMCSSNLQTFTQDVCQIISEIKEPSMERPLTDSQRRDLDFQIATLKIKANILGENLMEAADSRDYIKAQTLQEELRVCNKELETLQNQTSGEVARTQLSDSETLCRCLDILIGVLQLSHVDMLTPSLITCREIFLEPLMTTKDIEVHRKCLKCLALMALIDRATAEKYAKTVCIPLATYHAVPVQAADLVQSVRSSANLILRYGPEIIGPSEADAANVTTESSGKRRLYNSESDETMRIDQITMSHVLEIFMNMLDDERNELRQVVLLAVSKLVWCGYALTPTMLSRIVIKWYSPLTDKQDKSLQFHLGLFLERFMTYQKSAEIMKDAVIPTLRTVAHAPRTSPLADIDVDNMILFFSEMMNIHLSINDRRILALDVCMKIAENTDDRVVTLLTKFLCHMELKQENAAAMAELIERAEMLLESVTEKMARKNVEKYLLKLKHANTTINTTNPGERTNRTENTDVEESRNASESVPEVSEGRGSPECKRRKIVNDPVVLLKRLSESKMQAKLQQGALYTILEDRMETMNIVENLDIETPTSDESQGSRRSTKSSCDIISGTSDSDISTRTRRSKRNVKRRKL